MKYLIGFVFFLGGINAYSQDFEWAAISPYKHFSISQIKVIDNKFHCLELLDNQKVNLLKFNQDNVALDTLMIDLSNEIDDYTIVNNTLFYSIAYFDYSIIISRNMETGIDSTITISANRVKLGHREDNLIVWQYPRYPAIDKNAYLISIDNETSDTLYSILADNLDFSTKLEVTNDFISIQGNGALHINHSSDSNWQKLNFNASVFNVSQIEDFLYITTSGEFIPIINSSLEIIDSLVYFEFDPYISAGGYSIAKIENTFYLSSDYWFLKSEDNGKTWEPFQENIYLKNKYRNVNFFDHGNFLLWKGNEGLVAFDHDNQKILGVNNNGISKISNTLMLSDSSLLSFRSLESFYIEVFRSYDHGITWTNTFLDDIGLIGLYNYNDIEYTDEGELYFNRSYSKELFVSKDNNSSWQVADIIENQSFGDYIITTAEGEFYYHHNDSTFFKSSLEQSFTVVEGVNDKNLTKKYFTKYGQTWLQVYNSNEYKLYLYKLTNGIVEFEHEITLQNKFAEGLVLKDGFLIINEGKDIFSSKNGDDPIDYFSYDDEPIIVAETTNFTLANYNNILYQYSNIQEPSSKIPVKVDNHSVSLLKANVLENEKGEISMTSGSLVYYYGPPFDKNILSSSEYKEDKDPFDLSIYPNPTTEFINIVFDNVVDLEFTIFNLDGNIILQTNEEIITVSDFANGTYIIIGSDNVGRIKTINKFIKH